MRSPVSPARIALCAVRTMYSGVMQRPRVRASAPPKPRHHETAHALEIGNRHRRSPGAHLAAEGHSEELVFDAVRKVDAVRQHAGLGLQNMRWRVMPAGFSHGLLPEQRGLLLRTRNRDLECGIASHPQKRGGKVAQKRRKDVADCMGHRPFWPRTVRRRADRRKRSKVHRHRIASATRWNECNARSSAAPGSSGFGHSFGRVAVMPLSCEFRAPHSRTMLRLSASSARSFWRATTKGPSRTDT